MAKPGSWMVREIASVPDVVARQQELVVKPLTELASHLVRNPPQLIVTCGRGSSAHAATFAKHLFEFHLGIPVAAAAPSIASVYRRRLQLRGQLVLVISQSGRSDDLLAFAESARGSGANTVAITNDERSPLATICEFMIPIGAGHERSVPATKTFVASLSLLMRLTAAWSGNARLNRAIQHLPRRLADAAALDWSEAVEVMEVARSLAIIGRGPTLSIAREAALKLKETCNLHAEAFSSAEFQHGPVALLSAHYPLLMFMPTDAGLVGMRKLAADLKETSSDVLCADSLGHLPVVAPEEPGADATCLIQTFYSMIVKLAGRRGIDPDSPGHLDKITRTT